MFLRNTTPKTKRRWKAVVTQKPKSRRAPYNSKHPQQKHENSTNHSPSALWSKSTTERLKLAVCRYSIRSFPLFFFQVNVEIFPFTLFLYFFCRVNAAKPAFLSPRPATEYPTKIKNTRWKQRRWTRGSIK